MATTNDIYAEMQRYAPLELAESWDNPGLLVDCAREVSRVLVTLDITPEVVEEAAAGGCELIVSHHPVIFSPLKKLTPRDVSFQLVQKGISAICMHTNLDAAEGGVNEVLSGCGTGKCLLMAAAGWARLTPSRCRSWPARRRLCWAGGATGPGAALRCRSSLRIPAGP